MSELVKVHGWYRTVNSPSDREETRYIRVNDITDLLPDKLIPGHETGPIPGNQINNGKPATRITLQSGGNSESTPYMQIAVYGEAEKWAKFFNEHLEQNRIKMIVPGMEGEIAPVVDPDDGSSG